MVELNERQCRDLLSAASVGRVGFTSDRGIEIIPVNYVIVGSDVVIRTSASSGLSRVAAYPAATDAPAIAFEVDHHEPISGTGWSVLMNGALSVMAEDEVRGLESMSRVLPWADGSQELRLRFSPATISGRRVRRQRN